MSRYYVVTLFPELIEHFCAEGLIKRAQRANKIAITTLNPRDFTTDKHRSADDSPYGGGSGMVMRPGPIVQAVERAEALEADAFEQEERALSARPTRILLTPQGRPLTQTLVAELAQHQALTMVCGRYEGVDERARELMDLEVSLGDFVLMGGELGALALIEATARLKEGVLGNAASVLEESHAHGLLEYPQYTRPAIFRGRPVPEILLSGDHAKIAAWRHQHSLLRTARRRPDLIASRELSDVERAWLAETDG